jgi:hypothetical protein
MDVLIVELEVFLKIRIISQNLVRWHVNDVACLHVEINQLVGGSYLDIEDYVEVLGPPNNHYCRRSEPPTRHCRRFYT